MKLKKTITTFVLFFAILAAGCKNAGDPDQTNPIINPEDVFSPETLSLIRTPYNLTNNQLEITYIGNHGYLFSTLSKRILIDSLSEIGTGYERTSQAILVLLNEAEFPFNNIQLALTTHGHSDHFNVESVVDFLIANPQSTHLSTLDAETMLQGSSRYNQISAQSRGITPDSMSRVQVNIGGINVDVIRVDHHGDPESEHVMFLFILNKIKVLHVGDACKIPAQWESLGLEGENIDILIAPFGSNCSNWTLGTEEENPFDIIRQYIKPKHIIVSHLDFDITAAELEETLDTLEENLPGITFSVFHPNILNQKIYTDEGTNIQVIDKPSS